MKRIIALLLALLMVLLVPTALAEDVTEEPVYFEVVTEEDIVIVDQTVLDMEWLHAQIAEMSTDDLVDVMTALYIINTIQYGQYAEYDAAITGEYALPLEGLYWWLDFMGLEYTTADIEGGQQLALSGNVCIDIYTENDIITQMDLIIKSLKNAYYNDIKITITK